MFISRKAALVSPLIGAMLWTTAAQAQEKPGLYVGAYGGSSTLGSATISESRSSSNWAPGWVWPFAWTSRGHTAGACNARPQIWVEPVFRLGFQANA